MMSVYDYEVIWSKIGRTFSSICWFGFHCWLFELIEQQCSHSDCSCPAKSCKRPENPQSPAKSSACGLLIGLFILRACEMVSDLPVGSSLGHPLEGHMPLKFQAFRNEKDVCAQCHVEPTCGMLFDLENLTILARIMHNVRLKT